MDFKYNDKFIYPEGSQLVDVRYYQKPECFEVIYWSPVTHQLEVNYEHAWIDIWFIKKELRDYKFQRAWAKIEDCYKVRCKPSQIAGLIAAEAGEAIYYDEYKVCQKITYKEIYDQSEDQKSRALRKLMCQNPYVFKADLLPDVYYRLEWRKTHDEEFDIGCVTNVFLDIEVDVLDRPVKLDDYTTAPQPINVVTLIFQEQKLCVVFMLGPRPKNPNILNEQFWDLRDKQAEDYEWIKSHQQEFIREIKEDDKDNKQWIGDYDVKLHFFDFAYELDMIATIFAYINKYRPMFSLSWNAPFDVNYLINRIKWLGGNPESIVIPKELQTHQIYFFDEKKNNMMHKKDGKSKQKYDISTSKDFYFISSFTTYMCQMRLYAQIRKGQSALPSYSLNYVGEEVAGIVKLTDPDNSQFRERAYRNYRQFVQYNVRDVVVQLAIESIANDTSAFVSLSYDFVTQFSKCSQETHICRGAREFDFEAQGVIQACARVIDPRIDTKYEGAYVAPTEHNLPTGQVLNGKMINNIIYASLDADAKAYYPSTKMGLNLDAMTVEFKLVVNNDEFRSGRCINKSLNQKYKWKDNNGDWHEKDLAGPIFNSFKNGNTYGLTYNWFNLPSVTEYFRKLDAEIYNKF